MFRGLLLHDLERPFAAGELSFFSAHRHLHEPAAFRRHLAPAYGADWVVHAKRPFAGPEQVLDYVGRYTHRVAISNNRLVSTDNGKVRHRARKLARCRELLGMVPAVPAAADPPTDHRDRCKTLTGRSLRECPHCHGIMRVIDCIARPGVCQPVPDTS